MAGFEYGLCDGWLIDNISMRCVENGYIATLNLTNSGHKKEFVFATLPAYFNFVKKIFQPPKKAKKAKRSKKGRK